jgi:hypothetical protein
VRAAYRSAVASSRGSQFMAILVYTALRAVLLAAVWLVVELVTPIHGVWAVVVALLISGAISVVVLDRQRGAVGHVAAGFFGRINDRIEASTRAEDDDPSDDASVSGEGEQAPQGESVDKQ